MSASQITQIAASAVGQPMPIMQPFFNGIITLNGWTDAFHGNFGGAFGPPRANSRIFVMVGGWMRPVAAQTVRPTYLVTDTFGGTGGSGWSVLNTIDNGIPAAGADYRFLQMFTRVIGTGAVAGDINVNGAWGDATTTVSGNWWVRAHMQQFDAAVNTGPTTGSIRQTIPLYLPSAQGTDPLTFPVQFQPESVVLVANLAPFAGTASAGSSAGFNSGYVGSSVTNAASPGPVGLTCVYQRMYGCAKNNPLNMTNAPNGQWRLMLGVELAP